MLCFLFSLIFLHQYSVHCIFFATFKDVVIQAVKMKHNETRNKSEKLDIHKNILVPNSSEISDNSYNFDVDMWVNMMERNDKKRVECSTIGYIKPSNYTQRQCKLAFKCAKHNHTDCTWDIFTNNTKCILCHIWTTFPGPKSHHWL